MDNNLVGKTLKMNDALLREMNLHAIIKEQESRLEKMSQLQIAKEQDEKELAMLRAQVKKDQEEISQLNETIQRLQNKIEEFKREAEKSMASKERALIQAIQTKEEEKLILTDRLVRVESDFREMLQAKDESILITTRELSNNGKSNHSLNYEQALENYTAEETYIEQIKSLVEFSNETEEDLVAQLILARRQLENAKDLTFQDLFAQEKQFLEDKLDKALRINDKIENDMNSRINSFSNELRKLAKQSFDASAVVLGNKVEKSEKNLAALEMSIEGEKVWQREKAEVFAQMQVAQESYEAKLGYYEKQISLMSEEKLIEIEKYIRENEILKSEKDLLAQTLEDFKKIAQSKESKMQMEIERLNQCQNRLMELSGSREEFLNKEILSLNAAVLELQNAYDQRNKLITLADKKSEGGTVNWDQLLSTRLTALDKVNVQMRNALNDKKTGEMLKEGRNLILKMTDKLAQLDQGKGQQFEKKMQEKRMAQGNLEKSLSKFMAITDEFSQEIDKVLEKAKVINIEGADGGNGKDNNNQNSNKKEDQETELNAKAQKNTLSQAVQAAQVEIETTKYEEILTKKDAEINLAKKNLLLYKETVEKLEAKLSEKIEEFRAKKKINGVEDEEMEEEQMIARLSSEKIELEKENIQLKKDITGLQTEKDISAQLKEKYEARFLKELERIEQTVGKRFTEIKGIIAEAEAKPKQSTNQQGMSSIGQSRILASQTLNKANKLIGGGSIYDKSSAGQSNKELEKSIRLVISDIAGIKSQLKEIEKVYLENERFNTLLEEVSTLEARNAELEDTLSKELLFVKEQLDQNAYMAAVPSKKFDEGFDEFKAQCKALVELREQIENNEQQRAKFFAKVKVQLDSTGAGTNVIREGTAEQEREMLKSELLSLNHLLQTERENSHAELAASSAGMQRALRVLERKNESLKLELESVKGQNAEQLKNQENLVGSSANQVKALRIEVQNLSKLLNECHVKRVEEKRNFLHDIAQFEKTALKNEEDSRRQIESKLSKFESLMESKEKIMQQKYGWQKHEEKMLQKISGKYASQYKGIIEELQRKNEGLEEQINELTVLNNEKSRKYNIIITDLRVNIENIHAEKARLVETINFNNQLIQQKDSQIALVTQKYQELAVTFNSKNTQNQNSSRMSNSNNINNTHNAISFNPNNTNNNVISSNNGKNNNNNSNNMFASSQNKQNVFQASSVNSSFGNNTAVNAAYENNNNNNDNNNTNFNAFNNSSRFINTNAIPNNNNNNNINSSMALRNNTNNNNNNNNNNNTNMNSSLQSSSKISQPNNLPLNNNNNPPPINATQMNPIISSQNNNSIKNSNNNQQNNNTSSIHSNAIPVNPMSTNYTAIQPDNIFPNNSIINTSNLPNQQTNSSIPKLSNGNTFNNDKDEFKNTNTANNSAVASVHSAVNISNYFGNTQKILDTSMKSSNNLNVPFNSNNISIPNSSNKNSTSQMNSNSASKRFDPSMLVFPQSAQSKQ